MSCGHDGCTCDHETQTRQPDTLPMRSDEDAKSCCGGHGGHHHDGRHTDRDRNQSENPTPAA